MHQKLVPDPLLILVNNPKQPMHAINSFEIKIFWKRIIKVLKKWTLFFLFFFQTLSLLMCKVITSKRGLELVATLLRLQSKFREILLLVIYYVIYSGFWVIRKITSANLCKPIYDIIHQLFHFHFSFWVWKVWIGREKLQKLEYLKNKKSFLGEIKKNFHSF